MTLGMMILGAIALGAITLGTITLGLTILGLTTLGKNLGIMTFSKTIKNETISLMTKCYNDKCHQGV